MRRSTEEEHRATVWQIAKERQKAGMPIHEIWAGLSFTRTGELSPGRWPVERTFAWLLKYRRLSKDYEFLPHTSTTMVYLAMMRLMLKRLGKPKPKPQREAHNRV